MRSGLLFVPVLALLFTLFFPVSWAVGMEFVFVPGGCFEMGDTFGDGYFAEKPAHHVCLDQFSIGKYEVTRREWKEVMGNADPSPTGQTDDYPMGGMSYDDVQVFIARLNAKTGKTYRLPTEAEWEYACRSGGRKEKYAGFSDKNDIFRFGNFCDANCKYDWATKEQDDGYAEAAPVGSYRPNNLDIYDMSGNVWEWVADWFDPGFYWKSPVKNPKGPASGTEKVIRGGCWLSGPHYPRCTYRLGFPPSFREDDIGFRLVTSSIAD